MPFNLSKFATEPTEKYLRNEDNIAPAEQSAPIAEKKLDNSVGNKYTTTENLLADSRKSSKDPEEVIEKVLNAAKSDLVNHRCAKDGLKVPPINTLVEKLRLDRLADWDEKKKPNWTIEFNDKEQNGSLPAFPKSPDQHGKISLEADPRRFEGEEVKPMTGDLQTFASIASKIKLGESKEYDKAIVAILQQASNENRELSQVEQNAITDIKIARTKFLMTKIG